MTHVRDGGTIVVDGLPIRLNGLAAPEHDEPGGSAATAAMTALVLGREVCCDLNGDRTYDRCVGGCYLDDQDISEIMVRCGLARDCPRFSGGRYRAVELQAAAGATIGTSYPLPGYCTPRGGWLMHASLIRSLTDPPRLWSRAEVLTRPCPVPKSPGVYAWYFRPPPAGVPLDGCARQGNLVLLYIGISPKEPPRDGRPGSRQTLASRIRYHYHGNAEGSTLRLTLGCLLAEELGLELRRVGGGERLTFTYEGERWLSDWMGAHAFVAWVETPQPLVCSKSSCFARSVCP